MNDRAGELASRLEYPDNEAVRKELVALIAEHDLPSGPVLAGDLQANYFSFVMPIDAAGADGPQRRLFVKIPKEDLRRSGGRVLPLSAGDRRMGREEFDSLGFLAEHWRPGDEHVSFVRPVAFHEALNAIVTERADALDGCEVIRQWDLARRMGHAASARRTIQVMIRLGRSLRRFHDRFAENRPVDTAKLAAKLQVYASALEACTDHAALTRVGDAARRVTQLTLYAAETWTLKGIDLRNVLIGAEDDVFILDPGRMKRAPAEADLARFILTYRILWWGSPLFVIGFRPDPSGEAAFAEAYGPDRARGLVQDVFIVKEVLKHWHTAYDSLAFKPWSAWAKRRFGALVIDRFYGRQLDAALARLSDSR